MSVTAVPPREAIRTARERRAHFESLLVVVLSLACLALALVDLVLLATYSA